MNDMESLGPVTERLAEVRGLFVEGGKRKIARWGLADLAREIGCSYGTVSEEKRFLTWLARPKHLQQFIDGMARLWQVDRDAVERWAIGQDVPALSSFIREQMALAREPGCRVCGRSPIIPELNRCKVCVREQANPNGVQWRRTITALMPKVKNLRLRMAWERALAQDEPITDELLARLAGLDVNELIEEWHAARLPRKRGYRCSGDCSCVEHHGGVCDDSLCNCPVHREENKRSTDEAHRCTSAPRRFLYSSPPRRLNSSHVAIRPLAIELRAA